MVQVKLLQRVDVGIPGSDLECSDQLPVIDSALDQIGEFFFLALLVDWGEWDVVEDFVTKQAVTRSLSIIERVPRLFNQPVDLTVLLVVNHRVGTADPTPVFDFHDATERENVRLLKSFNHLPVARIDKHFVGQKEEEIGTIQSTFCTFDRMYQAELFPLDRVADGNSLITGTDMIDDRFCLIADYDHHFIHTSLIRVLQAELDDVPVSKATHTFISVPGYVVQARAAASGQY